MPEETLYMIEFVHANRGTAYMVYAQDETGAWDQALTLAKTYGHEGMQCNLVHFPHGFRVINSELPGSRSRAVDTDQVSIVQ